MAGFVANVIQIDGVRKLCLYEPRHLRLVLWPYIWVFGNLRLREESTDAPGASFRPLDGFKNASFAIFDTFIAVGGSLVSDTGAPPLSYPTLRAADELSGNDVCSIGDS